MSDVDLSPIGEQLGPIIFKILLFFISAALVLAAILAFVINKLLIKYSNKMKPFVRVVVSVLLGLIISFAVLILLIRL